MYNCIKYTENLKSLFTNSIYYGAGKWACPSSGHHVAKKYVETILAKVVVGKMTFCLGDHNNDLKDIFLVGPKVTRTSKDLH